MGVRYSRNGEWKSRYHDLTKLDAAVKEIKAADAKGWDCYFVPSVLRERSQRKYAYKESHVAWVDYDGSVEPTWHQHQPSYVVETSPSHYHAYWLLETPATSIEVEGLNKALATVNLADNSGWDCTQLLRIPGTTSKKRGCEVKLVSQSGEVYANESLPKTWNLWPRPH